MAVRKVKKTAIEVSAVDHKDKRVNIPTEELRDFVALDETKPKSMLYPRDPSLDPQLVWQGKDEQDQHPLEVPIVPIYIQEKVKPQAIVEQVRSHARKGAPQLNLFSDFNGIEFEQLVEFYEHEQNWSNRMILGDSLLVMTSLAEKEGLKGKVQMIYMDPPYGIKFGSNWQVSTRQRDVRDGRVEDLTRQPEQIKAFRDTWELGIHSYLSYLRDRLTVARELLTESGSIFVQIGDENVHLVRCVMDEVFGSTNCCGVIVFAKTSGLGSRLLPDRYDFLLWYAKASSRVKYRQLYLGKVFEEGTASNYGWVELQDGTRRGMSRREKTGELPLPSGARVYKPDNITSQGNPVVMFTYNGKAYVQGWKTTLGGMLRLARADRLHTAANSLQYVRYLSDFPCSPLTELWDDTSTGSFTEEKMYVVQTGTKTLERCLLMTTDPGDLVLDPTCGSGTTAYVAEQWGRRWITVDTSRVAITLARTRLMSARFPYYVLADSPDGVFKEAEVARRPQPVSLPKTEADIKKGFVYRRLPHVTLKSIANNEEIDVIYERWQQQIDPIRARLNAALSEAWEEWEVPHEPSSQWSDEVKNLHGEFWRLRRERQREIDASIARHADVEVLYDQPYEDPRKVRVTGRFTVESLSPHRVLSADAERPQSELQVQREATSGQFETMIIENLRKAGVQNTRRNERLRFDRLEPYAGLWLQAAGQYTDRSGQTRRVAVSIGPEHGTVGAEQVKEAAKEALKGAGFDLLVVCGLAFDGHAGETAKEFSPSVREPSSFAVADGERQYGRLPVMLARINADLTMGDELLKKTGAGNLFMVFGEPDIDIIAVGDGKLVVEVRGIDVYDPTTGQVRSSSTDDIACWFIDTDYNEESFFVRQAYFCGAGDPYEKLKRALRAEIDEAAWSVLYSTRSVPFERPAGGRIAVKVINHYGDEVLKVYRV